MCGRTDDMFVFNSMNIYPQDIEAHICQYPAVVDAAVLPKRSPVHGDIPVALVVFEGTASPDLRDLNRFVRGLAGQRRPRQFTVVDEKGRAVAGALVRSVRRPFRRMVALVAATLEETEGPATRSGPDGTFALLLERGEQVDLRVRAKGYAPVVRRACLAGERVRIVLRWNVNIPLT